MKAFARICLAALALSFAGASAASAADCAGLAKLALPGAAVTSAELVGPGAFVAPASPFPPPPGMPPASYKGLPSFCRVQVTATPAKDSDIKIEVWLPVQNWNGKFAGIGNGVWAGQIGYNAMIEPLMRGYAVAATDTGHTGSGLDATWAVGHPDRLVDFGYRAVHEMTVKAKAAVAAFYGKGPSLSLWVSCSTGGRQGLMEAYRYPADYDGISAMAPANPMTALMIQTIWTGNAALKTPQDAVPMTKLAVVHAAYLTQCDGKDGVSDGFSSDPERCGFDPGIVQCKGADAPDCLTAAQVETLRAVYGGVRDPRSGAPMFAGFQPGSEMQVGLLMMGPAPFPVATSYMRDVVFQDPNWDFRSFDYGKDGDTARKAGADILDVPPDGLKAFFARGGKLLLSHGWSDGLIPAPNTVAFYHAMLATMDAKTAGRSMRLFMLPGTCHCGGGDGPFVFDALGAIDDWASADHAPARIVASRPPGGPALSRPLCPYPSVARYAGTGDTNDAKSFVCVAPGK